MRRTGHRDGDERGGRGDGLGLDGAMRAVIVAAGLVGIAAATWTFVAEPAGGGDGGSGGSGSIGSGTGEASDRAGTRESLRGRAGAMGPRIQWTGPPLPGSIEGLEARVEADPDRVLAWLRLGDARSAAGDADGARGDYRRVVSMIEEALPALMVPNRARQLAYGWYYLGLAHAGLGEGERAGVAFEESATVQAAIAEGSPNPGDWYNLACFAALAGDREGALAAFERSVELGWQDADWAVEDPDLASVRDEPRFRAAVERIVPRERGIVVINP